MVYVLLFFLVYELYVFINYDYIKELMIKDTTLLTTYEMKIIVGITGIGLLYFVTLVVLLFTKLFIFSLIAFAYELIIKKVIFKLFPKIKFSFMTRLIDFLFTGFILIQSGIAIMR